MEKINSPVTEVCAFSFKKINNEVVYFRGKQWQQITQPTVNGKEESGKPNNKKSYFLLGVVLVVTVAALTISKICQMYDKSKSDF